MEDAATPVKRQPRRDRVTLDPVSFTRLQEWITSLGDQFPGLKVSRNALVNFIIQKHSAVLSAEEVRAVKDAFFDEIEFAAWALGELKKARAKGETLTLEDVVNKTRLKKSLPERKKREAKTSVASPAKITKETDFTKEELGADHSVTSSH